VASVVAGAQRQRKANVAGYKATTHRSGLAWVDTEADASAAPAAADLVLELNCFVQGFAFLLLGKVFAIVFHAAMGCVAIRSALMAMAQIKPSSSRPTAVVTFLGSLPAMVSFL